MKTLLTIKSTAFLYWLESRQVICSFTLNYWYSLFKKEKLKYIQDCAIYF